MILFCRIFLLCFHFTRLWRQYTKPLVCHLFQNRTWSFYSPCLTLLTSTNPSFSFFFLRNFFCRFSFVPCSFTKLWCQRAGCYTTDCHLFFDRSRTLYPSFSSPLQTLVFYFFLGIRLAFQSLGPDVICLYYINRHVACPSPLLWHSFSRFFTGVPITTSAILFFLEFILPRFAPRQRIRHRHFCFAFYHLLQSSRGFRFTFFIFCLALLVLFVSLIRLIVVFS